MHSAVSPCVASRDEFDPQTILTRLRGDQELLNEVIELFLCDCPQMLAGVRDAIARANANDLERTAHRIRGAIGNLSMLSAYEVATQLEQMGSDHTLEQALNAFAALETAVDGFITSLRLYAEQQSTGGC